MGTNSYEIPENGDAYGTGNHLFISSRAVSSNGPQRNFFPVNFNFDSYNIERLDLARGPLRSSLAAVASAARPTA